MLHTRDSLEIKGKVTINAYRAGMVAAIAPYLEKIQQYKRLVAAGAPKRIYDMRIRAYTEIVEEIKSKFFIRTAVVCPNLVMASPNYGLDLVIQRLVGTNTYSLNILWIEIGTGNTAPTLTDTALTTPTARAAVSFSQDYGTTDAIVQCYIPDASLGNATYQEVGCFIDGTSSVGSGQLFNHALLSPTYAKVAGQDTTIEIDFTLANV